MLFAMWLKFCSQRTVVIYCVGGKSKVSSNVTDYCSYETSYVGLLCSDAQLLSMGAEMNSFTRGLWPLSLLNTNICTRELGHDSHWATKHDSITAMSKYPRKSRLSFMWLEYEMPLSRQQFIFGIIQSRLIRIIRIKHKIPNINAANPLPSLNPNNLWNHLYSILFQRWHNNFKVYRAQSLENSHLFARWPKNFCEQARRVNIIFMFK